MADKEEPISDKEAYENLRKQMNYALIKVRRHWSWPRDTWRWLAVAAPRVCVEAGPSHKRVLFISGDTLAGDFACRVQPLCGGSCALRAGRRYDVNFARTY